MLSILADGLNEYVHAHTSAPDPIFERLREETHADLAMPQMQVGRVEGAFLRMLVMASGAKRVLEIGTFSGYSGLAMAQGLPEDGQLITCDIDPVATAVAQRYFDLAPWGHKISLRLAPAIETLRAAAAAGEHFDFVFIDADKGGYIDYWEAVMPLLPSGGLIVADNTLWSGKVLDPKEDSDRAIVAFNRHVREDSRVEHVLLSVRDGMMLARKR